MNRAFFKNGNKILIVALLIMLLVYCLIFGYLNMAKLVEHTDSDTGAEVLLAREIWAQKDLCPDNWISSTERRVISPATVAALFVGMGIPMAKAMGLACILIGAAVLFSFAYMLKTVGLNTSGILVSLLSILCLPINGIEISDSVLPFFTYLLFLFADYYALHVITMLLSIVVFIKLKQKEYSANTIILSVITYVLTLGLGASGMRCFQIVVAPILAWEIVLLYRETNGFKNRINKGSVYAYIYGVILLCVDFLGMLYPSSVNQKVFLQDGKEVINRILIENPAAVLKCMGIKGNASITSFDGLMQLLVYGLIALTVFLMYVVCKKNSCEDKDRSAAGEDCRRDIILYFALACLITYFMIGVSSIAVYHYYFFEVFFLIAVTIGCAVSKYCENNNILSKALTAIVLLFACMNILYTYIPAVSSDSRQEDISAVCEFLEEKGIEYGYAQFWNANRMTVVSDGNVTVGGVYNMSDLRMYWWLTNTDWFVPDLNQNMRTAYIVTVDEEEAFLSNISEEIMMKKTFESGKYIVYESDTNLVHR